MSEGDSPDRGGAERRILAIVDDYLARMRRGQTLDIEQIVADNADLAPELQRRLELVRAVYRASKESASEATDPTESLVEAKQLGRSEETAERIDCPHCGTRIQLVEPASGEVTCRVCGSTIEIDPDATRDFQKTGAPKSLGRFQIIEVLGRGAFGIVYKARDPDLNRTVALKVPRAGYFVSQEEETRFFREARNAARLRHPHIVAVHEVGRELGLPFIVSELIEGVTLADLARISHISFKDAAELIATVADALQYAHSQNVIHRDIKPSNILIDHHGRPYVTDFGLARADEGEFTLTVDGQVLGTPAYMSPEQAVGDHALIDPRSDVYSLGITLYRVLCGELPFRGSKRMMIHQVLHDEPKPPRSIDERIPRDLETITLKAVSKEPKRRYGSTKEMAEDLRRWIRGEPVRARPVGRMERLSRWSRRNPLVAALLASVLLMLTLCAAGGLAWAMREQSQREVVQELHDRAEARLARHLTDVGVDRMNRGEFLDSLPWLTAGLEVEQEDAERARVHRLRLGVVLERCPRLISLFAGTSAVVDAEFSPDGRVAAVAFLDGEVAVLDTANGQALRTFRHQARARDVTFSPDGRYLATASADFTVQVWDASNWTRIGQPLRHASFVSRVVFSPDSKLMATASSDQTAIIWSVGDSIEPLHRLEHETYVKAAEFSPDGARLATSAWRVYGQPCSVLLWDVQTGQRVGEPMVHPDIVQRLRFNSDGTRFATTCDDLAARVWDGTDGEPASPALMHPSEIVGLYFAPDDSFVTVSHGGQVSSWRLDSPASSTALVQAGQAIADAAFTEDARLVATAGEGRAAQIFRLADGQPVTPPLPHGREVAQVRFSATGRVLLSADRDGVVKIWSLVTPDLADIRIEHGFETASGALSPSNNYFATCGRDNNVRIWKTIDASEVGEPLGHESHVLSADFSLDDRLIATASADKLARVWELASRRLVREPLEHPDFVTWVRLHPQDTKILTGCFDGIARLWDYSSGQLEFEMHHEQEITRCEFSNDGNRISTSSRDGATKVWDVATRRLLCTLRHEGIVLEGTFSPQANRIVTASQDNTAVVWGLPEGNPLGEPIRHGASVWDAAFSSTGSLLASAARDGIVKLFNMQDDGSHRFLGNLRPFGLDVLYLDFGPQDRMLITRSNSPVRSHPMRMHGRGAVEVWDVPSREPITPPLVQADNINFTRLSSDGAFVVSVSTQGAARIWRLRVDERPLDELLSLATLLSGVALDEKQGARLVPADKMLEIYRGNQSLRAADTPAAAEAWRRFLERTPPLVTEIEEEPAAAAAN